MLVQRLFELCNGENTCEDIINEMNRRFSDIPVEVIQRDFEKTLKEFQREVLLDGKIVLTHLRMIWRRK